jgi:hypothetical protein
VTPTAALLEELRLLRAMGDVGRAAATAALRSARLALPTEDPMKLMTRRLDAAIVKGGGASIYGCKPLGDMSSRAAKRLAKWVGKTPRVHPDATGPKPKDPVGPERRRVLAPRPGRLVGTLTGKLGGFVSDIEDER